MSHKDKTLDRWTLDQDLGSGRINSKTLVRRTVTSNLQIDKGDKFQIKGFERGEEYARVDYIEFVPVEQGQKGQPSSGQKDTYEDSS
ncbi:MAG: hypothetical protein AAFQ57_14420, partial [Cyanobacteria bacterium J06626_14]